MKIEQLKNTIRNIPDFPKPGIQFKDITTLLLENDAFSYSIEIFYEKFKHESIDIVVGIESRGFIFAAPLAINLGCGLVLARKPGKLPSTTVLEEYDLEYGTDAIEMHTDSINADDRVLIIDDLLATGGTAKAAGINVIKLNGKIISYGFMIELIDLKGRKVIEPEKVFSILKY